MAGRLPGWLTCEPQGERLAVFVTYGAAGPHLDRYIDYLGSRTDQRSIWRESAWTSDARTREEVAGFHLLMPWSEGSDASESFDEYRQLSY